MAQHWIDQLKEKVLSGGELSFDEALSLIKLDSASDIDKLLNAAREITFHFNSDQPGLCSLVNAKSYLCGEDCGFCSQSVRFDTRVDRYGLMSVEEVISAAKAFEEKGADNFCIVTSGGDVSESEFEQILEMYRRLGEETSLNLDGSLGWLSPERIQRLKEAGVRRINNNLQSSKEFYPSIVSTHTYEQRLESLKVLQAGDMEICSGGIINMGESYEDRLRMAFELKAFKPHCLPVNILNPRPGTPLESRPKADPEDVLKTIAVFRFIHPKTNIKLAGGREANLTPEEQEKALKGGANGLIIGGYLTTSGNPMEEDLKMLKRAGFKPRRETTPVSS